MQRFRTRSRFMFSSLALLLLCCAMLTNSKSNARSLDDIVESGTIRIAVYNDYPPFSFLEENEAKGIDIDIANAICTQMKRECELVPQEWDGMIPALKAKKFDAIVASMSITEDRKTQVDFTDKYYQVPARLIASKEADFEGTAEGLSGKRIGVQRATTHQCYAEKTFPDAELVLYASEEEIYKDLVLGRIDAQLTSSLVAQKSFLSKDKGANYAFLGGDRVDLKCYGEGVGIAIRKGDELRTAINTAISNIREDGTYEKINGKYFPFDIYGARPASN